MSFPMLSGLDRASYAANSAPQNLVLLSCRPIIERAIASFVERMEQKKKAAGSFDGELAAAADERVFRIADMGCSSGPNCLANMQFMVETMRKYEASSNVELQCFFCDLPSNDFNTLLQLQHAQFAGGDDDDGCCFAAAVGGTVYGRLFPASCLHLVFSSCCLHWLSQNPKSISTPGTMEWNKGKIWVDAPLGNEATMRAYAQQWQQDINAFFKCRNEEMVKGGMMILVMLCRDDGFPPHQMHFFKNLELSWQQLTQEGVLEQSDLDTFNIPFYYPTTQEIITAVSFVPNLRIQTLEVSELDIVNNYWKQWIHDPNEWSTRLGEFYKSAFWNVTEGHLGTTKCEAIFQRLKELLKTSMENQSCWESYWVYPCSSYVVLQVFKDT